VNKASLNCVIVFIALAGHEAAGQTVAHTSIFPAFSDRAELILFVEDRPILTNRVVWESKTSFQSAGEGVMDGEPVRMSTDIRCDAHGQWTSLILRLPIHTTAIYRTGDKADLVQPDGTTNAVILAPGTFPFPGLEGLNLFAFYYDHRMTGTQIMPVIIPHKKPKQISVQLKRSFESHASAERVLIHEFEMKVGDELTASVWVDAKGRLIRSAIPSEKAVLLRKEFSFLARRPIDD
jgi:hypothetical protein